MMFSRVPLVLLAASLPLAACSVKPEDAAQQDGLEKTTAGSDASASKVVRDEVQPSEGPPVVPMAAPAVIQSQPGPDGSQVDLVKVAVTGDILTVTLRCSGPEKFNTERFDLKQISVIDDATSQRLSVLKDNDHEWMASNVSSNSIGVDCTPRPGVMWMKFPAPPATSATVSINIPEVAPFDGVPVTR